VEDLMRRSVAAALVGAVIVARPVVAQDYPAKPVRVVIPFAAGAGTDMTGRLVAQELTKRLGQQFFVENKPGAAAQLGTDLVAKAQPDGYTLLWTVTDGLSVLPAIKAVPYTIPDDFAFMAASRSSPTLSRSTQKGHLRRLPILLPMPGPTRAS
jgi:tripartite-type tricarboxylate transporter receptor subunit TctC